MEPDMCIEIILEVMWKVDLGVENRATARETREGAAQRPRPKMTKLGVVCGLSSTGRGAVGEQGNRPSLRPPPRDPEQHLGERG